MQRASTSAGSVSCGREGQVRRSPRSEDPHRKMEHQSGSSSEWHGTLNVQWPGSIFGCGRSRNSPEARQSQPGRSGQPCESSGWRHSEPRAEKSTGDPKTGEPVSRTSFRSKDQNEPRTWLRKQAWTAERKRSSDRGRIGSFARSFCRTDENPDVPANLIPDRPGIFGLVLKNILGWILVWRAQPAVMSEANPQPSCCASREECRTGNGPTR